MSHASAYSDFLPAPHALLSLGADFLSPPPASPPELRAPPTALRSFFIYECIQLHCVCKRMSQLLPRQVAGTTLLHEALMCQEYAGELDPGRSHLWFPPSCRCLRSQLPSTEDPRRADGATVTSRHRHTTTSRGALKILTKIPPNMKLGPSAEKLTTQ